MSIKFRQSLADGRVAELYLGGMSMPKVSAATGMGLSRVQTVLQRAGVKLRGRHERLPFPVAQLAIPPERMAGLYCAGASIEKVAAQAGVPSTRAVKLLRELGVAVKTESEHDA